MSSWVYVKFAIAFYIVMLILVTSIAVYRRIKVKAVIKRLTAGVDEISAEEFMNMRNVRRGTRKTSNEYDFVGVYIIHNMTRDIYYVGQSKKVLQRVSAHFGGRGNADVYADLKYGNTFTVKTIPLAGSGYNDLDRLESDTIRAYDAYNKGYNKNRGPKR